MGPPFVTTADAVDRETAWLNSSGDGLPALLEQAGGRWSIVQAYRNRSPQQRVTRIYVLRSAIRVERYGMIRKLAKYEFTLKACWPMANAAGNAEAEQRAFDAAIDDVLTRIGGIGPPLADKTHGGRFLSVAEDPTQVEVHFTDPDTTLAGPVEFEATIGPYWADDYEIIG